MNSQRPNYNFVFGSVKPWSQLAHGCRSLSQFLYHEAARSISTPPGRDASPSQVTTPQFVKFPKQFAGTHLYTWVKKSTVRVKCLAQGHGTISPARAGTRTAGSGVERTNHEATAPPFPFLEVRCNNHLTLYLNESTGLTGPALDRCKNYEIKKKN